MCPSPAHEPAYRQTDVTTDTLAIIPAREGSKGIPGKNTALIRGLPLIEYTVRCVRAARSVTGILITTDDPAILDRYRASDDLFVVERPPELATDDAKTSDAVRHALDAWTAAGRRDPDILLLAQPTTPLRTANDVDDSIAMFERCGREPLVSACLVEGIRHPRGMYLADSSGERGRLFINDPVDDLQRHAYESLYQRNGAIYLVTSEYFRRTGRLRSIEPWLYPMPWERSVNVDVPGDLLIARALIESGLVSV
jgi:CMP-N,N'-diacetyllegionaminic acid synthase